MRVEDGDGPFESRSGEVDDAGMRAIAVQTLEFWGNGKYEEGCDVSRLDIVVSKGGTVSGECLPLTRDKVSSSGGFSAIWERRLLFMEDSEEL
ncbi:MAG: hypothetical protein CL912_27250 [Deltaproteobacteria bacterium]|nr:hypothetical protein [Deltaproteobacteria bacterium]